MITPCELRSIILTGSAIALGGFGAGLLLRLTNGKASTQINKVGGLPPKALPVHRMNRGAVHRMNRRRKAQVL